MLLFSTFIQMPPMALPRPRIVSRPFPHLYETKESKQYKLAIVEHCQAKLIEAGAPFGGALDVDLVFRVARPKAATPKKRPFPSVKPDIDNFAKMVLDALNPAERLYFRGAWEDDAQVVELTVKKLYADAENPEGTYIMIHEATP